MKIALVRKQYRTYGGAENYLQLVAEALKTRGHDIHIFSTHNWPEEFFFIHKVRCFSKPSFLSNILFAVVSRAEIKKGSYDCVLSFERTFFQDIYRAGDGSHREWLEQRKIVEPFFKKLSFILNPHHLALLYLEKRCFFNSGTIIANSMMVKKDILKHYAVPDEKIKVVYNGIDLQRFQPVEKNQKTALKDFFRLKEEKVVLFVGADFKRKGLTTLVKALSLLKMKDIKLIVVGGKDTSQYLLLAKELGVDKNMIFWGTEKEIEKLYRIADVFVLPTLYDPFSNATLEAMASGVPVVTTSYNGASELIEDGVQGFVIGYPLNADAFSEKIYFCLQHVEVMGKKARMRAESYSIEKAVDSMIKIISGNRE